MKLRFTVIDGLGAKATRTVELMVKNYSNTSPPSDAGQAVSGGFPHHLLYGATALYGDLPPKRSQYSPLGPTKLDKSTTFVLRFKLILPWGP